MVDDYDKMILAFEPIKKLMRTRSNERPISDRAVLQMLAYVEDYVRNVTTRGFQELDELNKMREIQKIRVKIRLDDECIRRGARIINQECLNRSDKKPKDKETRLKNGVEVA